MVTRAGEQLFYENVKLGWAKNEEDSTTIMLAVTDVDNEEVHLFPISVERFEQFISLGRQTVAGKKIEVATQMPQGGPHGAA